ncbi:MAG: DUF4278 domain-containing protein [Leptolyngbyaceae cyanobacterium bins.59]|nr:DUF4278 domain-containing protein [Leptolyngbyaceae cyanobacterium bins.59]
MKLYYRGIAYDSDPEQRRPDQGNQIPYELKYRGISYRVDPTQTAVESPIPSIDNLTYRGVRYQVARLRDKVIIRSSAIKASATRLVAVPATFPRRYVAKVHHANVVENLSRRLQVAREHGDQQLVKLLEAEQRQIEA